MSYERHIRDSVLLGIGDSYGNYDKMHGSCKFQD